MLEFRVACSYGVVSSTYIEVDLERGVNGEKRERGDLPHGAHGAHVARVGEEIRANPLALIKPSQ